MWLVNAALRHPYTVWVGMLLVAALGYLSYERTPTDILPTLKAPVVVVFSSYRGMPAPDMEQTVTAVLERALTKCDHLEHIESRSMLGISIISVYFRPSVNGDVASSQVIALVNGEMQNMPPGMLPPSILNYDASAIPVGNLVITSSTRDDKYLLDLADHQLREELAGIEGLASAPVFGGVFRQVQIYVHPRALESLRMSPMDVARIVNQQSQVIPTGEIRIDRQNYYVRSNAMVAKPEEFGEIPLFNDGRKVVRLKDVAHVVDSTRWRTNVVRIDGRRAVYMPLLRQAGASAVRVVDNVQESLGELRTRGAVPEDVDLEVVFDQSQYVRDALANLLTEAGVGAVLASLVVLLFLGSLRTTWIVALSIPLSLLTAFAGLHFTGETLNIMTLGGLALVLGRVVDDSVVDVENTVRHLGMGKTPFQAALDSAYEISVPVLMATITTVIVFVPLVFMTGMGKYLFTPLAVSVALALFASYFVSRTVSPLLCARYLRRHSPGEEAHHGERFPRWLLLLTIVLVLAGALAWVSLPLAPVSLLKWHPLVLRHELIDKERQIPLPYGLRLVLALLLYPDVAGALLLAAALLFWFSPAFDWLFRRFTRVYEWALRLALRRRYLVLGGVLALLVPSWLCFRATGQELFPDVDSSEFTVHVRVPGGPRVEETEFQVGRMEDMIRGFQAQVLAREDSGEEGPGAASRTGRDFIREVLRSKQQGDEKHLAAIRTATPENAAVVERILSVASNPQELGRIREELKGRTFEVPGVVPPQDLALVLSNVGISSRWSAIYTPNNGPHAAFIRVQLRSGFAGRRTPALAYVQRLRERLKKRYPMHDFFFETGGMIRHILNKGSVAPIEVQVSGRDHELRREITRRLHRDISQLAGVLDANSPQAIDLPELRVVVDRTKAAVPGLTESDVIRNVITALMSSSQLAPNFWIDPSTGNPYFIGVQYPEYAVSGIRTLESIPITGGKGRSSQQETRSSSARTSRSAPTLRLEDVATIERGMAPVEVYHYAANRVSQLFVSVADPDLAGVASEIQQVVDHFPLTYALENLPLDKESLAEDEGFKQKLKSYLKEKKHSKRKTTEAALLKEYGVDVTALWPRGFDIQVRGEVPSMKESFKEMAFSLALAVFFVYLVMAAQFGSWVDPVIMIVSAPLGLVGVAVMLWGTGTSLNIQSCMGVLMMVGISVSNSVLLVEFANRQRESGLSTRAAAVSAAVVRLRPILMTTLATLVGLAPMAIHLHPGDEMNLPLARAVIGGLGASTFLTLFVVPVLYVLLKPHGPQGMLAAEGAPPSGELPAAGGVFRPPIPQEGTWGDIAFAPEERPQQQEPPADTPPSA